MHFFQNLAQVTITTEQVFHFKVMSQMILHCPVEHTKRILDMQIVWRRFMCCVSQVQSMLGCIPPWLSDNSSLWCNKTFENITGSEKEDIQFLLSNILDGFADDGECFFPVGN